MLRFLAHWPVLVSLMACALEATPVRDDIYGAEAVRAVMLFNFVRFTEWPASALPLNEPVVVGVAGNRVLEDELLKLASRQTVRERRIRVIRVNNVRSLSGCHVLYVGSASYPGEENAPGANELLLQLRNQPVLTVSDSPTFLSQGGIVNVYVGDEGKLRFEIAARHASEAGLTLSSRLLALARVVHPPEPAYAF